MKKQIIDYVLLLHIVCFSYSLHAVPSKPWTFLVYMAAANDLNSYALLDLQEMMKVGSTPFVNVIVYLTIQEDGKPKETKKLYVEQGSLQQIGPVLNRDSGDVATLTEALQWACLDYPSEHVAVVLWDHGSGPLNRKKSIKKGVCYDFDTGHYLTDRDCLDAFAWARDRVNGGKKFDIIGCDACLLASLEMAYTFSSCADYFVASEETIPGNGFQYAFLLNSFAKQSLDALSFAKLIVSSYGQEYAGTLNYTLSVTDLNMINVLVDNVNAVAQVLASQFKGKNYAVSKAVIKKCINRKLCPCFDDGVYIDLCQFYRNLLQNVDSLKLSKAVTQQFKKIIAAGIALFPKIIKAQVASKNYQQVGGLSMYFSRYSIDPSYYGLYWTAKNSNWLSFLEAFIG
jgi:hypothetical protein